MSSYDETIGLLIEKLQTLQIEELLRPNLDRQVEIVRLEQQLDDLTAKENPT